MVEQLAEREMTLTFTEKPLEGTEPARCVDGRPSPDSPQGPQMLGGSLHPIVLGAIFQNRDLDENLTAESLKALQAVGIKTGAHRAEGSTVQASGCGFADRIKEILEKASSSRDEISRRLETVINANQDKLVGFPFSSLKEIVNSAFRKIEAYSPNKIHLTGERLVRSAEKSGSEVETVQGDHAEEVAFVNINEATTLDTLRVNGQGKQGFNLDLMAAVKQSGQLGIPAEFSLPASLILYQATEMVLVEDKGKSSLPVEIHT